MRRVKRRIFSGTVCEQVIYTVSERNGERPETARPRLRFKNDAERAEHRSRISLHNFVRLVNANFGPGCYYGTLTLDDSHELYTFPDALRVQANYARRLLRAAPDGVIVFVAGRGENTGRIHFHFISRDIPEEVLRGKWFGGSVVRIDPLREHNIYDGIDHGRDYTALASYLFRHWTPEQGGHRYHIYGKKANIHRCDREDAAECKTFYSEDKPPRPPKAAPEGYRWEYCRKETVVTQYGYCYFKFVLVKDRGKTSSE